MKKKMPKWSDKQREDARRFAPAFSDVLSHQPLSEYEQRLISACAESIQMKDLIARAESLGSTKASVAAHAIKALRRAAVLDYVALGAFCCEAMVTSMTDRQSNITFSLERRLPPRFRPGQVVRLTIEPVVYP